MINRNYYKDNNLVSQFLGGKLQHYLIRERAVILESYPYTVQYGDTWYSLARKVFGEDQEFQWTYIAESNGFIRQPDDLQPGEVIMLPMTILSEIRYEKPDYAKANAFTTKI